MTRNGFIIGAVYWTALIVCAGHIPQKYDGSAARYHWAKSLDFDGTEPDGSDAVYFAANGWANQTLVIVPSSGNDVAHCDATVDEIASDAFGQELRARGFKTVRCGWSQRTLRKPASPAPHMSPRRHDPAPTVLAENSIDPPTPRGEA